MSTEVTTSGGFFENMKNAIVGVLVGILMTLGSAAMLFYNEYDALYRANDLELAEKEVISVKADAVDSANQGKLVHMSGTAVTDETLRDSIFGVSKEKVLKLSRKAEMYQWKETKKEEKKKNGNKTTTTTTYSYSKEWSNHVIDSSSFHDSGYDNPTSMRFQSESWVANKVTLGAFTLNASQVGDISGWQDIQPSEAKQVPRGGMIEGDKIYFRGGRNSGTPPPIPGGNLENSGTQQSSGGDVIGDIRISFSFVGPQMVSIYAGQAGNSFEPYMTSVGHISHMRLQMGEVTAKAMFNDAKNEAALMKWVLRLVGFILMFIGVGMVFRPIQVLGDVVPFIGGIVGMGLGILTFAIAAPSALFVIAVAWLMFRPLYGILLLGLGLAIFVGIYKMASGRKASGGAASTTAPPPLP